MAETENQITIYGTSWCYDTRRARALLDQNHIPYHWVDIDSNPEGRKYVETVNHGMRSVPTIIFSDGTILVEPSSNELSLKLGL
jgi:mycoredoxin